MYHIFVFSPLVEMLSKKYLALITLISFPVSYCKNIQFSNLFLHNLPNEGVRGYMFPTLINTL